MQTTPTVRPHDWLLGLGLAMSAVPVFAQTPESWRCRFCPEPPVGSSGIVELGSGHADSTLRFLPGPGGPTRATGSGALAWMGGEWTQGGEDGHSLQLQADRLGLHNPWLRLGDRQPGRYDLSLAYQDLAHRQQASGRTPFLGTGSASLRLPADWVRGASTREMSSLDASLRSHSLEQRRRRLQIGAQFRPSSRWTTRLEYHREEREGHALQAASMLTQSALLPAPVGHSTDRLDLLAEYQAETWLAELGYGLSLFRNDAATLRWANPYTALAEGADQGELAQAPDNQAHELRVSGLYFGRPRWQVSGSLAAARLEQDATLADPTANARLQSEAPLPRSHARAGIDRLSGLLRASYRPARRLRLQLQYRLQDRDNRTPQNVFQQVLGDSFVADRRRNLPYSFRDQDLRLRANYRPASRLSLRLGLSHQRRERDHQARRRTEEDAARLRLSLRGAGPLTLSAGVGFARREGSAFEDVDQRGAPTNARQRAFNLANRDRREARLRLDVVGSEAVQLGIQGDYAEDDYSDSPIGLRDARHSQLGASLSGASGTGWSWHASVSRGEVRREQAGSARFATADWWAGSRDLISTVTVGLDKAAVLPRVDLGLDYQFSRADGRIDVNNEDFPDLETRLHSLQLDLAWRWRPRLDWLLRYRYVRFDDDDWQSEGLQPDSLANVLGDGAQGFNEVGHLLSLAARYRF